MPSTCVRVISFIFGLLECLFLAGLFYGWPALIFILKEDGVYNHLCQDDVNAWSNVTSNMTSCPAQDVQLNLAFTVAGASMVLTLVMGWVLDKFGLRIARSCAGVSYVFGCLMLGFTSAQVPYLVFPGLICTIVSGLTILITNVQIGNYFSTKVQMTVATVYNAAFDTSSMTALFVKMLYEIGVPRLYSFLGIATISTILVGTSTFLLLPKDKILKSKAKESKPSQDVQSLKNGSAKKSNSNGETKAQGEINQGFDKIPEEETKPQIEDGMIKQSQKSYDEGLESPNNHQKSIDTQFETIAPIEEVRQASPNLSILRTVFSPTYLMMIFWICALQLRYLFYIGTVNVWLQQVTDNDEEIISMFTDVFVATMMCGLILGPLEGFILGMEERRLQRPEMTYRRTLRRMAVPKFLGSTFAVVLSVFALFPRTEFLYVQFVTATATRAFLYGLQAAFIVIAFPPGQFGTLYGLSMSISVVTGSSQYALLRWAEGPPRDLYPVNLFMLFLSVASYIQPSFLYFGEKLSKRNDKTK